MIRWGTRSISSGVESGVGVVGFPIALLIPLTSFDAALGND